MRELVYKNMTSLDHKKRDVFVRESVVKDGVVATSQRRCLYFIKDRIDISNPADLVKIAKIKKENADTRKCFHVLKEHDSKNGIDKLICKLKGTFFAVVGKSVYCIVFIHSFKIRFKTVTPKK